jgi:hypothetical protein
MEFDEIKKIWDSQNNEPLYAINEKALHNHILSRKKSAGHLADFSELLLIFVNLGAGLFVWGVLLFDASVNIFMYLMVAWMLVTAVFLSASRIRRRKGENRFDRSMMGDLDHAIANASYQVRISRLMRWNIFPIGIFLLGGFWESGKPVWAVVLLLIFFALTYYASGWEHSIYIAKKKALEMLRRKLESEDGKENHSS